ncbi:MAG: deoxyribose-phosphate aldolase [Spirochaetes bacterium]|nr:MAG: deoxyribose-phosphate aldolase [Spirochaetota bacterium]
MGKIRRLLNIFGKDGRAFIVAMDHGTNAGATRGLEDPLPVIESIEEGGADAVIVNGGPGKGVEEVTFKNIASAVAFGEDAGIPVVGEISPGGFDSTPEMRTLENIVPGARIASELGVDVIKTIYKPGFRRVIEGCFVPVVVLGGERRGDEKDFLDSIRDAMDSGAAGVAIGRNVWGAAEPLKMAKALSALIHDNASAEEALTILKA